MSIPTLWIFFKTPFPHDIKKHFFGKNSFRKFQLCVHLCRSDELEKGLVNKIYFWNLLTKCSKMKFIDKKKEGVDQLIERWWLWTPKNSVREWCLRHILTPKCVIISWCPMTTLSSSVMLPNFRLSLQGTDSIAQGWDVSCGRTRSAAEMVKVPAITDNIYYFHVDWCHFSASCKQHLTHSRTLSLADLIVFAINVVNKKFLIIWVVYEINSCKHQKKTQKNPKNSIMASCRKRPELINPTTSCPYSVHEITKSQHNLIKYVSENSWIDTILIANNWVEICSKITVGQNLSL